MSRCFPYRRRQSSSSIDDVVMLRLSSSLSTVVRRRHHHRHRPSIIVVFGIFVVLMLPSSFTTVLHERHNVYYASYVLSAMMIPSHRQSQHPGSLDLARLMICAQRVIDVQWNVNACYLPQLGHAQPRRSRIEIILWRVKYKLRIRIFVHLALRESSANY